MKIFKKLIVIIPIILIFFSFLLLLNISISIRNNKIPNIFGYSFSVIRTGSMEPDIKIGDLIIVKEKKEYNVGDVVSFYYDIDNDGLNESVTHKIIKIENDIYTLHGTNTKEDDIQLVEKEKIYGKVIYISTFFGNVFGMKLVKYKSYMFLGLIICLALFAIYQVINIVKMIKENKKPSKS